MNEIDTFASEVAESSSTERDFEAFLSCAAITLFCFLGRGSAVETKFAVAEYFLVVPAVRNIALQRFACDC
jgi:hypothetical protein